MGRQPIMSSLLVLQRSGIVCFRLWTAESSEVSHHPQAIMTVGPSLHPSAQSPRSRRHRSQQPSTRIGPRRAQAHERVGAGTGQGGRVEIAHCRCLDRAPDGHGEGLLQLVVVSFAPRAEHSRSALRRAKRRFPALAAALVLLVVVVLAHWRQQYPPRPPTSRVGRARPSRCVLAPVSLVGVSGVRG